MSQPSDNTSSTGHIGALSIKTIEHVAVLASATYALKRINEGGVDPVRSKGKVLPYFKDPKDELLVMPARLGILGFFGHVMGALCCIGSYALLIPLAVAWHTGQAGVIILVTILCALTFFYCNYKLIRWVFRHI